MKPVSDVLPPLELTEFAEVFRAIHGYAPYAWQNRLLREVVRQGRWPEAIAAPTGAGKTAVLDIALFHLALQAGEPDRSAPLRIVLAVDRRIIVDQAFERARRIRAALRGAAKGGPTSQHSDAVARMAQRLAILSGAEPLHVAELRGGIPMERDWAKQPDQPTILCTTVDQLGSRLLFRGYGVSTGMAPLHAGLLGVDALLILDEAHLSAAFAETLRTIARRRVAEKPIALPWGWTAVTATPRDSEATSIFRLTDDERAADGIRRRLAASKPTTLMTASADTTPDLADAFAQAARDLRNRCTGRPAPVIAVVVNRVALARAVFDRLKSDDGADAILLTGRVRPVERDELVERYRGRLEGRSSPEDPPLFVVATQCIEAGADFDVDAMVSQIAPLDALRQRFGRLARTGNRDGTPAPAVILASKADIDKKPIDPIYGDRLQLTWTWLNAKATKSDAKSAPTIDMGPDALDALIAAEAPNASPSAAACTMPARPAPLLRHADVAFFAMTAPRPQPDPEPSLFLHGEFRPQTDVSVIWRADLEDLFEAARATRDESRLADLAEQLLSRINLLPPRAGEALSLPAWRVKAWLAEPVPADQASDRAAAPDALADIDGAAPAEEAVGASQLVLRWSGAGVDAPELVEAKELRPGDLVILPASDGGCDAFGWAPDSHEPVRDIAELAAAPYAAYRAVLRIHPKLLPSIVPKRGDGEAGEDADAGARWDEVSASLAGATARQVAERLGESLGLDEATRARWQQASSLRLVHAYGEDDSCGVVLLAPKGLGSAASAGLDGDAAEPWTESDLGSFGTAPETLRAHSRKVARFARLHAQRLGLPPALATALAKAALWHDAGKADPRFQAFLRQVGQLPTKPCPLAKSGRQASRAEVRTAKARASLPDRWRHEVQSVRYAARRLQSKPPADGDVDADLVLWLIGTHHGEGRPFFAHDDDWDQHENRLVGRAVPAAPGPDKLDFDWNGLDWPGLMARLQARYGVWGLAFLEACLRLADHRASAASAGGAHATQTDA